MYTMGRKFNTNYQYMCCYLLFGSTSRISRFCERLRDGQYSLASFLFAVLLLTVLPVPSNL